MDIHAILEKHWGYSSFRPLQEDIIRSVLNGNDTLALLPTGGGKSICFQVPALAKDGLCIVISPLIALMKDQVENLIKRGVPAATIYSGMHLREIELVLTHAARGKLKFLYLSPERLKTNLLKNTIREMSINLLAVDEAHCISQWGYDFRPPYLEIAAFRKLLPADVPVLALTATATPEVVKDIQTQLHFREENVFQKSFYRENLTYFVFKENDKQKRLLQIINRTPGTGIVYVRNRRKTQLMADFLNKNRISADFYHAGLGVKIRDEKQNLWMRGKTRVIVATNAFGMGIDKPDVRFVIHLDIPDNVEAYFQEAGRGGRDEKRSYAILLYEDADVKNLYETHQHSFPPVNEIRNTYEALCNYLRIPLESGENASFELDVYQFIRNYKLNALSTFSSLKFLERAGFIALTEAINNPSKVYIPLSREDLYRFQVANERYDNFIKLLLRSYSGLLTIFTPIQEKELAKRSGLSVEAVVAILKQLDSRQVLIYQQQTENPSILFLQDRIDSRHLLFSKQVYEDRKEMAQQRLDAVINYVTATTVCRSKALLAYFGEKQTVRCGKCDVCLRRNREELSDEEFQYLQKEILSLLKDGNKSVDFFVETLHYPENKIIQVIRKLLENNMLSKDMDTLTLNDDQ
jgi:ATP-dependent DNA helicase RecQ